MRSHPDFPRIARAVARLRPRPWSGAAYRSVSPAYANGRDLLSGEGVRRWGGRWNAAGSFAAVYASLAPETAIAEALANVRHYGIPDADALPRVVVALDASLEALLDLTDGAARRVLRVSRRRLRSEPWRRAAESGREALTQAIGRAALDAGLEALLVPSAADRAGSNLVVFPRALRPAAASRSGRRGNPDMHICMQNCLTPAGPGGTLLPVSRTLVGELRADLGVSRRLFARLTGYSERAIASWEAGRELSEPSRQRMLETRRLEKALARVMKPSAVGHWLEEPNRAFRGLKPLEVIERGEVDRIWRMLFELESGTPG